VDDDRFDTLSRAWSGGFSRRALGSLATGALAALGLTVAAPGDADARKKKKKKKKKKPACTPTCASNTCGVSDGCGGTCKCGSRFECSDSENGGVCECNEPFESCNNNTLCCQNDEDCVANACCLASRVCNGVECCAPDEECTTFDGCCPEDRACPDVCCAEDEVCCGGECCLSGNCTNDVCCDSGNELCASNDDCCGGLECIAADGFSICCTQTRFCTPSSFCCDNGETCIDDECCPNERVFGADCCPVERFCGPICCPAGQACCGDACIDVLDDEENCGGCGVACDLGEACVVGDCLGPDQYRIVLRWGEEPRDLDAHLWLPAGENQDHVYYDNPGNRGASPFATFDGDDTNGFGPETMSIFQLYAGTYTYAVNLVQGEGTLGTSSATVEVYEGSAPDDPIQTYSVPASDDWEEEGGDIVWWKVFELDGATGQFTAVNAPSANPAPYEDDLSRRRLAQSKGKSKDTASDSASQRNDTRRGAGKRSRRREDDRKRSRGKSR
jgi:hypothetical protein